MKFGVYASGLFPGEMAAETALDITLAITRTARDAGFDGVFLGEHHLMGPESMTFPLFPLLGRLTAEFPGGYLGTASHLASMSHPVHTAENAAFLDVMTGGRFILGVGQGYRDVEFASLGIVKSERGRRLRESIRAMKEIFREDGASFKGEHFQFDDISIRPRPLQLGGPPIWVGSDNLSTIASIPTYADGWISSGRHTRSFIRSAVPAYRRAFEEQGRSYPGVPMFRDVYVAKTLELAEQRVGSLLMELLQRYHQMGQPGENYDVSVEEAAQDRLVVGTPEAVAESLASYRDEFEVPFMWFRVYWPGMALEAVVESVQMLGEEVLPLLR